MMMYIWILLFIETSYVKALSSSIQLLSIHLQTLIVQTIDPPPSKVGLYLKE